MRPTLITLCVLSVGTLGAGCSDDRGPATRSTAPAGMHVIVPMEIHGVLHVPSPNSSGVQGRLTSWLSADDGSTYDLVLEPGFEPLADPASSGRGVTISGNVSVPYPAPVGAEPFELRVTGFSFD